MIQKVFAVYDSKACAFLQPFFSNSVGSAVRAFADASNEDKSPIARHPGDYQLYEIGTFDDNSGLLDAMVPTKLLGCAADFVEVKKAAFGVDALRADKKFMDSVKDNAAALEAISNGS